MLLPLPFCHLYNLKCRQFRVSCVFFFLQLANHRYQPEVAWKRPCNIMCNWAEFILWVDTQRQYYFKGLVFDNKAAANRWGIESHGTLAATVSLASRWYVCLWRRKTVSRGSKQRGMLKKPCWAALYVQDKQVMHFENNHAREMPSSRRKSICPFRKAFFPIVNSGSWHRAASEGKATHGL